MLPLVESRTIMRHGNSFAEDIDGNLIAVVVVHGVAFCRATGDVLNFDADARAFPVDP